MNLETMIRPILSELNVRFRHLCGGSRASKIANARAVIAYKLFEDFGISQKRIADQLSISSQTVSKSIEKGRKIIIN